MAKDQKHLKQVVALKSEVTGHLESFEFHLAAEKLYHYVWHTFADKIVEETKPRLKSGDATEAGPAYALLETIFLECLTMLHPFVPFVTEAIYEKFRPNELLMIKKW